MIERVHWPRVTALLVCVLAADAFCLVSRERGGINGIWGGSSSTVGAMIETHILRRRYARAAVAPMFPEAFFRTTEEGVRYVGPARAWPPVDHGRDVFIGTFVFVRTREGFWAYTTERTRGWVEVSGNASGATTWEIAAAARGHLHEMEHRPRYAEDCERIVDEGSFDHSRILLGGVLHNAIALALLVMTVGARVLAWRRDRAARRGRGLVAARDPERAAEFQ